MFAIIIGMKNGLIRLGPLAKSFSYWPFIVSIPPMAGSVAVLTEDPAAYGVNFGLRFLRAPLGRARGNLNVLSDAPVRIPNGSRAVKIENRTGLAVVPTLIFELHL